MSLVSRLLDLLSGAGEGAPAPSVPDEQLAAAALLVHVARVDGRIVEAERRRIEEVARSRFGIGPETAAALIDAADAADREAETLSALVERTAQGLTERRRLLSAAYAVAAADGRLHEFEEDLVWRLGRLLGFDDGEIVAIRDAVGPGG